MPKRRTAGKPVKPYPDFPLTANGNGQWSKKVRGEVHYFGKWEDWQGALQLWTEDRDNIMAGRKRKSRRAGLSVVDLVNRFLTVKKALVDSGEMAGRTWNDYQATGGRMLDAFGRTRLVEDLAADDFEPLRAALAKTRGPVSLANEIQRVRSICKYAADAALIPKPVSFGPEFKKPSKKVRRKLRTANGPRMFKADEIQKLIKSASPQLQAMILLGINAGMGNHDLATMPLAKLDLTNGWHDYERPKTGMQRRCPLWPETIKAVAAAIKTRPTPKDDADAGLLFITKYGKRWVRLQTSKPQDGKATEKTTWIDSISLEFGKLLFAAGLKRPGIAFYSLRRTFRTIAAEAGDQPAARFIMGHADDDSDMDATYTQAISSDRLRAVTDHVRVWLFGKVKAKKIRPR